MECYYLYLEYEMLFDVVGFFQSLIYPYVQGEKKEYQMPLGVGTLHQ